ncbi:MAG: homocitrate synthase [Candidatus Thermofonsia Clade 1 bacterium]|uniref:Homocitrate synthase n=1 Tax=Candidatus Thermofonsia Clade 1 bacterium TaxID=2364210 RepID=A0A2M8PI47_9CHLR|nr:MAG: homocitrate synthase [Candidatus Thermofonsia Clade 1 bacterium]
MSLTEFAIIESTLREGEQFANANFTPDQKRRIAEKLDEFGVEMLELSSPVASPQSEADVRMIVGMRLRARILTHIRCNREDALRALDTGVDGLDIVIGTSAALRKHSHGKTIDEIIDLAREVLTFVRRQAPNIILRFSTEDSFRSSEADLLRVYLAVAELGVVNRLGVADTVGIATPQQVYTLVSLLRRLTHLDVEFHGHNDSGCAIANAYAALEAGATHVDTTVLGIGERNGITPLGGLIARLYFDNRELLLKKYRLDLLYEIDHMVAEMVGVQVPFNNYITGETFFTHKAGIHTKAVLAAPETYESINPSDFGLKRRVQIAHRLTGWNAVRNRAQELGLSLSDEQIKAATQRIKALADQRIVTPEEVDEMLRAQAVLG